MSNKNNNKYIIVHVVIFKLNFVLRYFTYLDIQHSSHCVFQFLQLIYRVQRKKKSSTYRTSKSGSCREECSFCQEHMYNNSRPLSADDIQKAEMCAMFMREKYGKVDTSKVCDKPETTQNKKSSVFMNSNVPHVPRSSLASTARNNLLAQANQLL